MAAQAKILRARLADGPAFGPGRLATSLALALITALAILAVHVAAAPASIAGQSGPTAASPGSFKAGVAQAGSSTWGGRHGKGGGKGKGKGGGKGGSGGENGGWEGEKGGGGSGGGEKGGGKGGGKGKGKGKGKGGKGGKGGGPGGGEQPAPQAGGGSNSGGDGQPAGQPSSPPAGQSNGQSNGQPNGQPNGQSNGNSPSGGSEGTAQPPADPQNDAGNAAPTSKPKSKSNDKTRSRNGAGSPRREAAQSPASQPGSPGAGQGSTPASGGGYGVANSNAQLRAAALAAAAAQNRASGDGSGEGSGDGSGSSEGQSNQEANSNDLRRKAAVSRAVDHVPLGFRLLLLLTMFAAAVLSVISVRERRRAQSVARVAQLDYLTGLANREGFDRMLGQEWRRAVRYGRPLGLVFVDIDHFKAFNDSHGHLSGDRLLREVAAAISSTARGSDYTARLGGDEFVVLCPESSEDGLSTLAERLTHEAEPLEVSLSIGHALQGPDDVGPEDLVARADAAMYRAKGAGRPMVASGNPMLRAMRRGSR